MRNWSYLNSQSSGMRPNVLAGGLVGACVWLAPLFSIGNLSVYLFSAFYQCYIFRHCSLEQPRDSLLWLSGYFTHSFPKLKRSTNAKSVSIPQLLSEFSKYNIAAIFQQIQCPYVTLQCMKLIDQLKTNLFKTYLSSKVSTYSDIKQKLNIIILVVVTYYHIIILLSS